MRDDIPLRECIQWLRRYKQPPDQPRLVALLVQQLGNFERNPDGMRDGILRSVEQIEVITFGRRSRLAETAL